VKGRWGGYGTGKGIAKRGGVGWRKREEEGLVKGVKKGGRWGMGAGRREEGGRGGGWGDGEVQRGGGGVWSKEAA